MINPFCSSSLLNRPLLPELCQRIHAEALLRVARGRFADEAPGSVPAARLRELISYTGPETCLAHPDVIEHLFQGMTVAIYQVIEALYCSRIERSIKMLTRIVEALATRANRPPIHEEAIWATCLYLDEQRERSLRVTTKPGNAQWWLGEIAQVPLATPGDRQAQSPLVAVIDICTPCVLAFRGDSSQSKTELAALSLYDALITARCPHPFGAGGLVWEVPTKLLTTETLPQTCERACALLGVKIDSCTRSAVPLIEDLATYWRDLHTQGPVSLTQRAVMLDSILNRVYGESPLRKREQADHRFRQSIGYQSDPAHLVPALRTLLPSHDASINACGEVFFNGFHYTDDLLTLFPEACISLRRSQQTEAVAWVYLDGEILGEARARELARRDGSYRAHR
jgi:hypothetical protein